MTDEIKFNKYGKRGAGYHWDQISKSNIFVKLLFLLPSVIIKKISLLLDKKGRSERYIMGYFVRVEK